jgi:hypothetical protein
LEDGVNGLIDKEASQRAGAFCQWYEETHDRIIGVGYFGSNRDYMTALQLVKKFSDDQLQKAAIVWFGMNDSFALEGTRTVPKFASRITACLERMKQRGIA